MREEPAQPEAVLYVRPRLVDWPFQRWHPHILVVCGMVAAALFVAQLVTLGWSDGCSSMQA